MPILLVELSRYRLPPRRTEPQTDTTRSTLLRACALIRSGPQHTMLHALRQLASPNRIARYAEEELVVLPKRPARNRVKRGRGPAPTASPPPPPPPSPAWRMRHSPGTIRRMSSGWSTPLHFDSKHSNAWAALRRAACNEDVQRHALTNTVESAKVHAITRHSFAASAILTLDAPDRLLNAYDLSIYRLRFPALLNDCATKTVDAYAVGARLLRTSLPKEAFARPCRITAEPGDVFLFNSEFLHE